MKQVIIKILIGIGIAITIFFVALMFTGCKSFNPITLEGQPDECNDFYSILRYYTTADKGDSAFIGIVYNECKAARAQVRQSKKELNCREIWYGKDKLIDKTDYQKYTGYLECNK